ncbi:quinolinate synthase NadA [Candidatus Roizmanbacteria bacterium]|nr:quinolinate synthase NadA [Candidatus Roizmanbacteria bacterium]
MINIPKLQKENLDPKKRREIIKKILYWKEKRDALIIAHNYQIPGIQDIADYVGDSLELSKKAASASQKLLVFCGVHFMAESAAIFSPEKTVLIPDLNAGCSLAASIDAEELRKWKRRYPNAVVVSYVNTTAEVKAESDYCVTSTNAVRVVQAIPEDKEIIFLPDLFLGDYVARKTGRKNFYVYPGECHVHARVRAQDILKKLGRHPTAEFLIHPECGCVSDCLHYVATKAIPEDKTHILSTSGMLNYAKNSEKDKFVVATEIGILHRLKKENPKKKFLPLRRDMICEFMKMITLEKLLNSLENLEFEVKVPKEIAEKAKLPIERMLAIG